VPVLLSQHSEYQAAGQIGSVYNDIYTRHSQVWEDQGRTPEFLAYFADLVASFSTGDILEIGCGEGFLLASLRGTQLAAIDLSSQALKKASAKLPLVCCVALAERLPFSNQSFDLVLSVGVMEHFLNDREATKEIFRVLKPGGHYLALIHVHLSRWQSIQQKLREYFYPRFRPLALGEWILKKVFRPIAQPIQRSYTRQSAKSCFDDCGFILKDTIGKDSHPEAPLIGPHVLIFVASKR
jgi:SAM-dependent methyltransferase